MTKTTQGEPDEEGQYSTSCARRRAEKPRLEDASLILHRLCHPERRRAGEDSRGSDETDTLPG